MSGGQQAYKAPPSRPSALIDDAKTTTTGASVYSPARVDPLGSQYPSGLFKKGGRKFAMATMGGTGLGSFTSDKSKTVDGYRCCPNIQTAKQISDAVREIGYVLSNESGQWVYTDIGTRRGDVANQVAIAIGRDRVLVSSAVSLSTQSSVPTDASEMTSRVWWPATKTRMAAFVRGTRLETKVLTLLEEEHSRDTRKQTLAGPVQLVSADAMGNVLDGMNSLEWDDKKDDVRFLCKMFARAYIRASQRRLAEEFRARAFLPGMPNEETELVEGGGYIGEPLRSSQQPYAHTMEAGLTVPHVIHMTLLHSQKKDLVESVLEYLAIRFMYQNEAAGVSEPLAPPKASPNDTPIRRVPVTAPPPSGQKKKQPPPLSTRTSSTFTVIPNRPPSDAKLSQAAAPVASTAVPAISDSASETFTPVYSAPFTAASPAPSDVKAPEFVRKGRRVALLFNDFQRRATHPPLGRARAFWNSAAKAAFESSEGARLFRILGIDLKVHSNMVQIRDHVLAGNIGDGSPAILEFFNRHWSGPLRKSPDPALVPTFCHSHTFPNGQQLVWVSARNAVSLSESIETALAAGPRLAATREVFEYTPAAAESATTTTGSIWEPLVNVGAIGDAPSRRIAAPILKPPVAAQALNPGPVDVSRRALARKLAFSGCESLLDAGKLDVKLDGINASLIDSQLGYTNAVIAATSAMALLREAGGKNPPTVLVVGEVFHTFAMAARVNSNAAKVSTATSLATDRADDAKVTAARLRANAASRAVFDALSPTRLTRAAFNPGNVVISTYRLEGPTCVFLNLEWSTYATRAQRGRELDVAAFDKAAAFIRRLRRLVSDDMPAVVVVALPGRVLAPRAELKSQRVDPAGFITTGNARVYLSKHAVDHLHGKPQTHIIASTPAGEVTSRGTTVVSDATRCLNALLPTSARDEKSLSPVRVITQTVGTFTFAYIIISTTAASIKAGSLVNTMLVASRSLWANSDQKDAFLQVSLSTSAGAAANPASVKRGRGGGRGAGPGYGRGRGRGRGAGPGSYRGRGQGRGRGRGRGRSSR